MPEPEHAGADPLAQLAEGPVFVIGHARSGTTWVYEMLAAHPEVAGVLESWIFWRFQGLAGLFDHWDDDLMRVALRERGEPVGVAQLVSREELTADVRALVSRWLARKLEPGHRFLVEKTPTPYTAVAVVNAVFPEARIVHVLRDGRDVAVSMRAAGRSWFPQWATFVSGRLLGRAEAMFTVGRSWAGALGPVRRIEPELGDRYLQLSYENMVADPGAAIRRLYDFCRIPLDDGLLERVLAATDFQRNFAGGEDQFRRGGRVGDWRERFGLLDGLAFELGSRGRLVSEGYERRRAWPLTRRLPLRGRWPERRRT